MSESHKRKVARAAMFRRGGWAVAGLFVSMLAAAQSGQPASDAAAVTRVVDEQLGTEQAAQQTQERIEQLDDETRRALAEFRAVVSETASLRRYNEQLAATLESQADEMQTMQQQLGEIETTAREIVPLLQKMLATLEAFVALDLPFLPEERAERIAEAYQVEMEYGRTLEAYQGRIDDKTVEFLRVGRVSLMYRSLDGAETGYWDADARRWVRDDTYHAMIAAGLKVARKQAAPDLLSVPVAAPREAQ
jgi:septal ring factor EnvC (AmiA/AmiB activator)